MSSNRDVSDIPKISSKDINYDETPIGRGGYGYVFRGVHKDLGTVAIKTLINSGLLPARHLRVFKSEGRKLWELRHPSVVRLLGLIMEEGNYSLVLEYMHFGSLTAFRSDFTSVDWSLLVSIIKDVVHGMHFLHSQEPPILHLDLKSDNILVNRRIRAKITDFGLSQWKTMTRTMSQATKEDTGRKGTVTHVPPEVWKNVNTPANKANDIYSFAIVLWETVVGDRPFARISDTVIPSAVIGGQRPDMSIIPKDCPKEVTIMTTECWAQEPEERPEFAVLKTNIDELFEKLAANIPEALDKLEKEIQDLYNPEDIGGDTAETANSENLYDAASKVTDPEMMETQDVVEVEDIGAEEDLSMIISSSVSENERQDIVGLKDRVSAEIQQNSSAQTKSPPNSVAELPPKFPTQAYSGGLSSAYAPAAREATRTGSRFWMSGPAARPPQGPPSSALSGRFEGPGIVEYASTEEEKKAVRRILRDPAAILMLENDAKQCQKIFNVDLELQKKIKDTTKLAGFLQADPVLRMELQRKGYRYFDWLFHSYRMKDIIKQKRPARRERPEYIAKMRRLREEQKRKEMLEEKNMGKMRKMAMNPYGDMDSMMDMEQMMPPDVHYGFDRRLRDPMRNLRARERYGPRHIQNLMERKSDMMYSNYRMPTRSSHHLERHMMDMDLEDEMMMRMTGDYDINYKKRREERKLMDLLKNPGLPEGSSSSSASAAGSSAASSSSASTYSTASTSKKSKKDKKASHTATTLKTKPESKPSTATRLINYLLPSKSKTTAQSTTTTAPSTTTTAPSTSSNVPATLSKSSETSGQESVTDITMSEPTDISDTQPEIKSLPDDHLVRRQENVKYPVQRHTDTEPLKTAFVMIGGTKNENSISSPQENLTPPNSQAPQSQHQNRSSQQQGQARQESSQARPAPSGAPTLPKANQAHPRMGQANPQPSQAPSGAQTQPRTSRAQPETNQAHPRMSQAHPTTYQAHQRTNQTHQAHSILGGDIRIESRGGNVINITLNSDGTLAGGIDPTTLPPGIQFGVNNTMFVDKNKQVASRGGASSTGSGTDRSQDYYKDLFLKLSTSQREINYGRDTNMQFAHVDLVARSLGSKWIQLAKHLEMDADTLREMELEYKMNNQQDDYECTIRVIADMIKRKWYYGRENLISSLREIHCQSIALNLLESF